MKREIKKLKEKIESNIYKLKSNINHDIVDNILDMLNILLSKNIENIKLKQYLNSIQSSIELIEENLNNNHNIN